MPMKQWIPWTIAAGCVGQGPVVMLSERCGWNGGALAVIVLAALVSDIFDGVLAQQWKTDTATLRVSRQVEMRRVAGGRLVWP